MKVSLLITALALFTISGQAQKADEVLATAKGLTFTAGSLSDEARKAYLGLDAAISAERAGLFAAYVRSQLIDAEAKATGVDRDTLIARELARVPAPSESEIKQVYEANRQNFGGQTLEQVRPQIVGFLRNAAEHRAVDAFVDRLKAKHKFAAGKDINSADLKPADIIFTINGKPAAAAEFIEKAAPHLYDAKAEIIHHVLLDLEGSISSALVAREAKERSLEPADLIAAEITNKLKEFTAEERTALERSLKDRLYQKYAVKILLREPEPVPHNVSADDDPVWGRADAPVTVVMFSDFQCSACAATHPVLKTVLASYPDKARLVVRDFPLESIHENAFAAALAANAARQQGKFFEYIELLYQNQDKLDQHSLRQYAVKLGLNLRQFELDFSSEKTAAEVRKDRSDGVRHGARGTPTIFINGVRVSHLSADSFRTGIERAIAKAASK